MDSRSSSIALIANRPDTTPEEIDRAEREWWENFSEIEERITWVQTPSIQRVLRGRYLREIVKLTPPQGKILELGCGTGWLCHLLARLGASSVCGVDFSPAQIARAETEAATQGLRGVRFVCTDGTSEFGKLGGPFDCVVVHGFLHHLNATEIRRTLAGIPGLLTPKGVLIVFEPIRHAFFAPERTPSRWVQWQLWLAKLAQRGQLAGWRKTNSEEMRWRDLLARRNVGIGPHGPSPKEMPFEPAELEAYLESHFVIRQRRHAMALSHQVAQEWLLRRCANPLSTRMLLPVVVRVAAWLDRRILADKVAGRRFWTFAMYICERRNPSSHA